MFGSQFVRTRGSWEQRKKWKKHNELVPGGGAASITRKKSNTEAEPPARGGLRTCPRQRRLRALLRQRDAAGSQPEHRGAGEPESGPGVVGARPSEWYATKTETVEGTPRVQGASPLSSPDKRGRRMEWPHQQLKTARLQPWMAPSLLRGPWVRGPGPRSRPRPRRRKRTQEFPSPTRPPARDRPRVSSRGTPSPSPKPRTGLRLGRMMGSPGGTRLTCSGSSAPCCSPELTNSPCACSAARRRWRRSRSGSSQPGTGSYTRTATSGGRLTGKMVLVAQGVQRTTNKIEGKWTSLFVMEGWINGPFKL